MTENSPRATEEQFEALRAYQNAAINLAICIDIGCLIEEDPEYPVDRTAEGVRLRAIMNREALSHYRTTKRAWEQVR